MKRTTLTLVAILLAAGLAHAATTDVTTAYFTGYVYVPATNATVGSTGLTISNAYLCFPASLFTISASQATGDVRQVMYSLNQEYYDSWTAKVAGSRSASEPVRGTAYTTSGTTAVQTVTHILKTIYHLSGATLP